MAIMAAEASKAKRLDIEVSILIGFAAAGPRGDDSEVVVGKRYGGCGREFQPHGHGRVKYVFVTPGAFVVADCAL
jgi:hypothetical protein